MKAKWFISALLFICLCFGAFQDKVQEPNQEIVLEFVQTKNHEKSIGNTIIKVQEKLKEIGAINIVIHQTKKGTLKISYYSAIAIKNIKKALSEDNQLALSKDLKHKENKKYFSNYSIDIYELTNTIDFSNLDDTFVVEIKYHSDRFTSNNFSSLSKNLDFNANQLFKTAYKVNKNHPFTKDYRTNQGPEVRAGPKNNFI